MNRTEENQEGFPKLCLAAREGGRGRRRGSTLVALSLSLSVCASDCETLLFVQKSDCD